MDIVNLTFNRGTGSIVRSFKVIRLTTILPCKQMNQHSFLKETLKSVINEDYSMY